MWPVAAAAFARVTTAASAALCAAGVLVAFETEGVLVALESEGVLAVTAGVEPDPPVLVERPCRAKNHTAANRHTLTSAI
jgi:hypothetical protein